MNELMHQPMNKRANGFDWCDGAPWWDAMARCGAARWRRSPTWGFERTDDFRTRTTLGHWHCLVTGQSRLGSKARQPWRSQFNKGSGRIWVGSGMNLSALWWFTLNLGILESWTLGRRAGVKREFLELVELVDELFRPHDAADRKDLLKPEEQF